MKMDVFGENGRSFAGNCLIWVDGHSKKLLFLNVMMCNHLKSNCGQLDLDGFMNQLNFEMSSYQFVFFISL